MSSNDALLDLFEYLRSFLVRLEVYTAVSPTPMMVDLIIKVMVETLFVLALATKQIKQGRFSKCAFRYTLLMLNVSQRNLRRSCGGIGETRYRLPSRDWTG